MEEQSELSRIDIIIISQQLAKRTDEEIAEMIEKPLELVKMKIHEITGGGKKKQSKSQAVHLKTNQKKAKELQALNDQMEKQQRKNARVIGGETARHKTAEPVFKTREVDYNEKVLLRIDSRTCIYIDAKEDPEIAKERFQRMSFGNRDFSDKEPVKKPPMKRCRRCDRKRKFDDFRDNKRSPDKKMEICLECESMLERIRVSQMQEQKSN